MNRPRRAKLGQAERRAVRLAGSVLAALSLLVACQPDSGGESASEGSANLAQTSGHAETNRPPPPIEAGSAGPPDDESSLPSEPTRHPAAAGDSAVATDSANSADSSDATTDAAAPAGANAMGGSERTDGATPEGSGESGMAPTDGATPEGSGESGVAPTPPQEEAAAEPLSAAGHGPLSDEAYALFWGSPEDPPAEHLDATRLDLEGRHYLYSDERNLHLFFPRLASLGGGYAGVGSDQAYLFIGIMRPSLAWLTDYDPWIKWLHWSYFAFFDLSPDIDTFMAYWDRQVEDESAEVLAQYYADREDLDEIIMVFREANRLVHRRLRRLRSRMTTRGIDTFVTDEETYRFVRQMVQNGRVRPMLANLLDDEALLGIGEVGRQLGVPLRALYLSNAEDYWTYPDQFRRNMEGLYFDERSLILRANASKPDNDDYRYNMQSALNFREWLAQPYVHGIDDIWDHEYIDDPSFIPVSFLDAPPVNPDAEDEEE